MYLSILSSEDLEVTYDPLRSDGSFQLEGFHGGLPLTKDPLHQSDYLQLSLPSFESIPLPTKLPAPPTPKAEGVHSIPLFDFSSSSYYKLSLLSLNEAPLEAFFVL